MRIEGFAAAKVNLTLHVLGRRTDGYHELDSLVAFADVGDRLWLDPGQPAGCTTTGPFARAVDGENLVEKTLRLVASKWPEARLGHVTLEKNLPVAAGIGGGSADAAATLRALQLANPGLSAPADWQAIAKAIGADVPVCLVSRFSRMQGLGERVTELPSIAPLPAVLVNPRVPLATAAVFKALAAPPLADFDEVPVIARDAVALAASGRNDLEPVAAALQPAIIAVRSALLASQGCQLARLSGSGPTCFGLFGSAAEAAAAAGLISNSNPGWWVANTTLR